MPQSYENAPPCPFCGGTELLVGLWSVDEGEVDAIEDRIYLIQHTTQPHALALGCLLHGSQVLLVAS